MKTKIILVVCLLLSIFIGKNYGNILSSQDSEKITLVSSPDIYYLVVDISKNYTISNPNQDIEVLKSNTENNNLSIVSSDYYKNFNSNFNMVIGRDVIVIITSPKNPLINEINKKGISLTVLSDIIKGNIENNWGNLLKINDKNSINYYISKESFLKLSSVIKSDISKLNYPTFDDSQDMINKIENDPNSIGFCRLNDIKSYNNIKFISIDKNNNGKIDYMEDIYQDIYSLNRGIWIGKYPKELYNTIYIVSNKDLNENEKMFANWIISKGQIFISSNGFNEISYEEISMNREKLFPYVEKNIADMNQYSYFKFILLAFIFLIFVSFILNHIINLRKNNKNVITFNEIKDIKGFDENDVALPQGIYYDKTHIWSFMEKDGNVKVGIDDFLQHITGKIDHIIMKNIGDKLKKNDLIVSISQNGKRLNILSPINGTITEINKNLINNTELINNDPYNSGWIYKIEPINWKLETQFLTMSDTYKNLIKNEISRLKDFIVNYSNKYNFNLSILQDGGVLKDNILSDFGPEVWEDFQTNFLK